MEKQSSNPRYKTFAQATFTAGDESQFYEALPRREVKLRDPNIGISGNLFAEYNKYVFQEAFRSMKLDNLSSRTVFNTFEYMFYKFKKGIFVSINDGQMQTFLPFLNARYRNEWSQLIRVDTEKYGTLQNLLDKTSSLQGYKRQNMLPLKEWQANDGMFRYEQKKTETDNNVETLKDMLLTLCANRDVPDIELFINKRDHPLLKDDGTEPYENLYGTKSQKLVSYAYPKYSPIFSLSIANGFVDVMMPTYEDWARAKYQRDGVVFPNSFKTYPRIVRDVPWIAKKGVAVFRGTTTGAGVTPETNQRLNAFELASRYPNYLDVGITKWNLRVRKHIDSKYLETIDRKTYPTVPPMALQAQANTYKYLLTLEGHVAAYRLSYELSSGSLVLLADSKWKIWYSRFLKPFVHYVPVKNDLSDLIDRIEWCRTHDSECQQIVANAIAFYDKYLGVDGILDYLQLTFTHVAQRIHGYAWLPDLLDLSLKEERYTLDKAALDKAALAEARMAIVPEYKFPLSPGPRCIGKLIACSRVLHLAKTLEFVRTVFQGKNSKVDCVKTNGFYAARKTTTPDKAKEQAHEMYIGTYAVNDIIRKCPNFAYTYGYKNAIDGAGAATAESFTEFVDGPTLDKWIASDAYNEKELLNIMCAINLALEVAQNQCAFVHYDLTPWNVIVQTLRSPVPFDYDVGTKEPRRFTSNVVPIIVDYGKSRAVVYDASRGLIIDRGYVNLFRSETRAIDTMTLIYSTINSLRARNKPVPRLLIGFLDQFKLCTDVKSFVDAWAVINYVSDNSVNDFIAVASKVTPMAFVDYIAEKSHAIRISPVKGPYKSKMDRGNAFFEERMMAVGDANLATTDTVNRLYRQTIPVSETEQMNKFIKVLINNNLADLDEKVDKIEDEGLKQKYAFIKQRILDGSKKTTAKEMVADFPFVVGGYLKMDAYITPLELERFLRDVTVTEKDWVSILSTCAKVALLDPSLNVFEVLGNPNYDQFEYLNEIASNNTLEWINAKLHESS